MNQFWVYGVIEEGGDVSALGLRAEMAKFRRTEPIMVRINSPGGSVFEAVAIRTALTQWPAGVDVQIDGLAASAASYLATIGRNVAIARDGMVMLHDAWGVTIGNSADHKTASDTLDQISQSLVGAYAAKSGKSSKEIRDVMKSETWFTSDGALEFGLVDAILGEDGKPSTLSVSSAKASLAAMQRRLDAVTNRIAAKV